MIYEVRDVQNSEKLLRENLTKIETPLTVSCTFLTHLTISNFNTLFFEPLLRVKK